MNLVYLNLWGGNKFHEILDFVRRSTYNVDVFMFQEVFDANVSISEVDSRFNLFKELEKILPDHCGYFSSAQNGYDLDGSVDFDLSFGLASFIRKSIIVSHHEVFFVYGKQNSRIGPDVASMPRNAQLFDVSFLDSEYRLVNFHGLWQFGGKNDSPARIMQSNMLKNVLYHPSKKIIVGGDFNLLPNTQSLRILEDGFKNLIFEYNIKTTRSVLYCKDDKFADYVLVSPKVQVQSFQVLDDIISDHLPLYIELT